MYRKPEGWHKERQWQTRLPKQFLGSFKEQSPLEHSEIMPACPKSCSLPFAGSPSQILVLVMPIACQQSCYILHLCSYLRPASSPTFLPSLIICILPFSDTWSKLMCQLLRVLFFLVLSRLLHIEPIPLKFSSWYLIIPQVIHIYTISSLTCLRIGAMIPTSFLVANGLPYCPFCKAEVLKLIKPKCLRKQIDGNIPIFPLSISKHSLSKREGSAVLWSPEGRSDLAQHG